MWKNLDAKCGGIAAENSEISYFDSAFSLFLFLTTVPANLLILIGLYKHNHLFNLNYYLVIGNIALADLIMGLICDPMSVSFHLKEALGPDIAPIQPIEQSSMTYIFFLTNTVAVLSMAVLTFDRLGVMLSPFYYYSKMTKNRTAFILASTWIISALITTSYLFIGYIRFLVVFALTTVILTLTIMIITMILLRRRLRQAKANELQRRESNLSARSPSLLSNRKRTEHTLEFTQMDKKITKTFLCMLLLFILNYLPCLVLTTYMNVCEQCDCMFVHVLRDIVFLAILSSALFRAINFIVRLKALQNAIKAIFRRHGKNHFSEVPLNGSFRK